MGLFSKEDCCICGKSVGILNRKKLQDKNYICKDCENITSGFIDVSKFTKDFVINHMEYMKKQNELYKKEFETLPKDKKDRYVCVDSGIVFADSIGMFEVLSHRSKKREYHELFRYDQIESYEKYVVENTNTNQEQGGSKYKYSESGIIIKMKCRTGRAALGQSETYLKNAHPYVEEFKIKLEGESNSNLGYAQAINHLDKIFRKEETYKSFGQTVKEDFIGNETQRRHIEENMADLKNLAGMVGAKIKGDEDKISSTKANLQESMINRVFEAFGACDKKYTELADKAEQRAWNN